jgi:hypothetical protein
VRLINRKTGGARAVITLPMVMPVNPGHTPAGD